MAPSLSIPQAREIIASQEDIPLPIKKSGYRLFLHELGKPDPKTKKPVSPRKTLEHVIGWMKIQAEKQAREAFRPNPLQKRILYLLIVEGFTQGQAALELKKSEETIKFYCRGLKKKLGVESFNQVVAVAIYEGWIPPPSLDR